MLATTSYWPFAIRIVFKSRDGLDVARCGGLWWAVVGSPESSVLGDWIWPAH